MAVAGLVRGLQRAVFVHAHKLDGAAAGRRGHDGVRCAAVEGNGVGVRGPAERAKAARSAVAGRAGRRQQRDAVVEQHVARVRERAGRAGRGQRQVGCVAREVRDAPGQGVLAAVAQVVRAVAGSRGRIGKGQPVRAVAQRVAGRPCGPVDVKGQRGARIGDAAVRDWLVKDDGYGGGAARAVRAVDRGDRHYPRRPCVGVDVPLAAQRACGSGRWQDAADGAAGVRMRDLAASRQGVDAGVVEVGGRLAAQHRVAERELGRVVARSVPGDAARVEAQLGLPGDAYGAGKGHVDADYGALPVRPTGGRRVDAEHVSRRQPDQLDGAAAVDRGGDRVRAAAHAERVDAVGAAEPVKAGRSVGRRSGREQGAVVAAADADRLYAVVAARGDYGVRAVAAGGLERGDADRSAQPVKGLRAVPRGCDGL